MAANKSSFYYLLIVVFLMVILTCSSPPQVNGGFVSLPHMLPSGVSLSSGVNEDKSEVIVILRRDDGMESELKMEIGANRLMVKVPLMYSGKLCGVCGNPNDLHSDSRSWVLPDVLDW